MKLLTKLGAVVEVTAGAFFASVHDDGIWLKRYDDDGLLRNTTDNPDWEVDPSDSTVDVS